MKLWTEDLADSEVGGTRALRVWTLLSNAVMFCLVNPLL